MDGNSNNCKSCVQGFHAKYYKANPGKFKARGQIWLKTKANRAKANRYSNNWYHRNSARIRFTVAMECVDPVESAELMNCLFGEKKLLAGCRVYRISFIDEGEQLEQLRSKISAAITP